MQEIWNQKYQIIEKLGKGGNGQVYRVLDLSLGKDWAMKEILPENTQEMEMLKTLSHKSFPRIVDAFEEEDRKFLVMDLIEGIPLSELLKKGSLMEKEVIFIGKQLVEALSYLHERTPSLLYLDLKPANIIVGDKGEVRLVDLGSILRKGSNRPVSGTIGYASPEQLRLQKGGKELNEQSDIYSLGMVLFVMLTGKTDRLPIMEGERKQGFLLHQYQPLVSNAMERLVEKCTRGDRRYRYESLREVSRDLERCERDLRKKGIFRKFFGKKWRYRNGSQRKDWCQAKSILCTEGKLGVFSAGRMTLLLVLLILWIPVIGARAEETQRQSLEMVLRDGKMRKVLVKEGTVYQTEGSLILELPKEEMEEEKQYTLRISCAEEGGEERNYTLSYCYKR